jgi:hypothetical protein
MRDQLIPKISVITTQLKEKHSYWDHTGIGYIHLLSV